MWPLNDAGWEGWRDKEREGGMESRRDREMERTRDGESERDGQRAGWKGGMERDRGRDGERDGGLVMWRECCRSAGGVDLPDLQRQPAVVSGSPGATSAPLTTTQFMDVLKNVQVMMS